MSSAIGGLASGIDTGAIVDSLIAASSRSKDVMTTQKGALEDRREAYATLSSRLSSLSDALGALDTPIELRSASGRSRDDASVGVSVAGDAVIGRFQVKVNHVASASMAVSGGFATRDTNTMATGTLAISVGSTTTNVTIDAASASLDDVVEAINTQVAGVTAYVMETGDAANPYRLVVAGEDTGLVNAVSFDSSGLDPATGTLPAFTEATAAADAEVEVNGIVVTDDDNDIDAAIQGVTFHAYETTTSTVEVTVERDDDAMVDKLQTVATAWNSVMSLVRAQRAWNPDEDIKGAFVGESVPNAVVSRLQGVLSAAYGSGGITSLGAMGLTTTDDGDLELDEDALRAALDDDFDGVVGVVTGSSADGGDGAFAAISAVISSYTDEDSGIVTAREDSLDDQIETMGQRLSDFEDRLDAYRTRLEKQFTAMEITMARFQSAQSSLAALLPDTQDS